jgi:hypothetical protein
MPHPSDDYLSFAGDCIGMANAMHSDDLRHEWFRLAQQWIAIMPDRPRADGNDIAERRGKYFGLRRSFLSRSK